jgi:hypothetical protein
MTDSSPGQISRHGWWSRRSFGAQLFCVLVLAICFFAGSVPYGFHEARQCAVEYPHDGQCGLEVMACVVFGIVGGGAILLVGSLLISYQHAALKRRVGMEDDAGKS